MNSVTIQFPLITVREPDYTDVRSGRVHESDDFAYVAPGGERVYAIIEVGGECILYTDQYVDWWGDGGHTPGEVLNIAFARMIRNAMEA